MLKEAYSGVFK